MPVLHHSRVLQTSKQVGSGLQSRFQELPVSTTGGVDAGNLLLLLLQDESLQVQVEGSSTADDPRHEPGDPVFAMSSGAVGPLLVAHLDLKSLPSPVRGPSAEQPHRQQRKLSWILGRKPLVVVYLRVISRGLDAHAEVHFGDLHPTHVGSCMASQQQCRPAAASLLVGRALQRPRTFGQLETCQELGSGHWGHRQLRSCGNHGISVI
mmetsp:Transcript_78656/g.141892  ORF Transcript_78656/g.141892 Transcript_78656/m.141892 type:complete len:208 (-) Transcript_78656:94-717(-)